MEKGYMFEKGRMRDIKRVSGALIIGVGAGITFIPDKILPLITSYPQIIGVVLLFGGYFLAREGRRL